MGERATLINFELNLNNILYFMWIMQYFSYNDYYKIYYFIIDWQKDKGIKIQYIDLKSKSLFLRKKS